MANIGDVLRLPEEGWKRYEEDNPNFNYINGLYANWCLYKYGSNNSFYSENQCMVTDEDINKNSYLMKVKFNVITDKIRIIVFSRYYNTNNVEIKIDNNIYKYDTRIFDKMSPTIVFEKLDLLYEEHTIEITNLLDSATNNCFYFDSIDIDENGILKSYKKLYKYFLKYNNQHYTIKDNKLTSLENQILNKSNFEINGFNDLELLNSIDKTDMKLLVYDESNPDKLKLKYTLKEPFRPIDKFEGKIKILKQEMK